MKIVSGKIYALQIPFVETFAHSAKTRKFSDSFIVHLTAEDGANGYGEGVARQYVTGETVETSIAFIKNQIFPLVETVDFDPIKTDVEPLESLEQISGIFTDENFADNVIFHAARAAVESALIDCLLKSGRKSLAQILPPKRDFVTYSGVITTGTTEKAVRHAKRFKLFGINQLKIKIANDESDVSRVEAIKQVVGEKVSLRLDANAAFDLKGAIAMSEQMSRFGIDVIEQPIPRGDLSDWAELKKRSMVPIMADESIVTRADAEELIENRACDFFNLRISKCGGIANVLKLAHAARKAGIRLQLGCQVGETAILSAVGRHVAAHLETLEYVEGSFGNLLLTEDVGRTNINFGHGGRAPLIRGDGIGIEIREQVLEKYAIHIETLA